MGGVDLVERADKKAQQKQFRDEIVGIHLQVASEKLSNNSRSGPRLSIPTPVRYDGKGHYPQDFVQKKCKDLMQKVRKNVALIHVHPGFLRKVVFVTVQNKGHFKDLLCIFDFFSRMLTILA